MAKSSGCCDRKRKGPRIKKLRTLEMIEADLQLVMRMFLGSRMNERFKTDVRMSNIITDLETDARLKMHC